MVCFCGRVGLGGPLVFNVEHVKGARPISMKLCGGNSRLSRPITIGTSPGQRASNNRHLSPLFSSCVHTLWQLKSNQGAEGPEGQRARGLDARGLEGQEGRLFSSTTPNRSRIGE